MFCNSFSNSIIKKSRGETMSFIVRLLIVEDEVNEITSWNNLIEIHNADLQANGFKIELMNAKSLQDAINLIDINDFDAAVVDIRLEQGKMAAPNTDGNEVVSKLLEAELAIVAVFTGEIAQVDIPDWAKQTVKSFRKGGDEGEGTTAVLSWLCEMAPMIQSIRQAQQIIKSEMVKLFTKSIWPRWKYWMVENSISEDTSKSLSRHLVSHVHATLLEEAQQKVHPEEWYFVPPVRHGVRTGDLIEKDNGNYEIVITPRCDLAIEGKVETIQLAECVNVLNEWSELCNAIKVAETTLAQNQDQNKTQKLNDKIENERKKLRAFTQHNNKASVHFLPPIKLHDGNTLGPFLVQFTKIRFVNKSATQDIETLIKNRTASLTPEFLPSLVERLGGYFSRIGTPDYSHPD